MCIFFCNLEPILLLVIRGGVLEDVLGLQDVLENTIWSRWLWPRRSSPWPWPRSLKSTKIALSSARWQHYFWIVKIFFCEHFYFGVRLKNFLEDFCFEIAWNFFLKTFVFRSTLASVSLILGLEPCVFNSTSACYDQKFNNYVNLTERNVEK